MSQSISFSTSRSNLSFTEVVQLSNMASYGLPTNLLFCKSCQTVYKEPKLLPCLHTFCLECLEKETQDTNRVTCTLCGYSMILPPEGTANLTTNIFAERVVHQYIDKIQEFAKSDGLESRISFRNSMTDEDIISSLMEKSKYSPNSLSLFSLPKRDNSFHFTGANQMASNENNQPSTSNLSDQPDLVQSHSFTADSIQNMVAKLSSQLDQKLMALQGEALRVTYAIDSVNQTINNWRDDRYQLKRKVEDRSSMLQHQIRRHEKRLIAEIDNRYHEDTVMKDAERSKHELRQNLKGILQTVEFLKQVQDFATDEEMIELKDKLLACSVKISEVQLKWQELVMEIPKDPVEHLMVTDFGKLSKSERSSVVFLPGSLEMEKDISAENSAFDDSMFADQIFSYTRSPAINRRPRRQSSRASQTDTETDLNTSDASVIFDQFRTMRESFKQKRRQLLEGNTDYNIQHRKDEQTVPILESTGNRFNSSRRKKVRSFAGSSSIQYDKPDDSSEPVSQWARIEPLPPNASSRDITNRNEISRQMAHLSNENREDKIKRMQDLRESWKRRKEVLMQNDGYISPSHNTASSFNYEDKVQEVIEQEQTSAKQSRMQQLKNRFSQIRQHFKQETLPSESTKLEPEISTEGVVRRNKPKEKKEKRWSGIFKTKESKRKSLQSGASTEFVICENTDFETQALNDEDITPVERKRTNSIVSRTGGLTRKKLQQMRDSVRKKTQRWRTINSA